VNIIKVIQSKGNKERKIAHVISLICMMFFWFMVFYMTGLNEVKDMILTDAIARWILLAICIPMVCYLISLFLEAPGAVLMVLTSLASIIYLTYLGKDMGESKNFIMSLIYCGPYLISGLMMLRCIMREKFPAKAKLPAKKVHSAK